MNVRKLLESRYNPAEIPSIVPANPFTDPVDKITFDKSGEILQSKRFQAGNNISLYIDLHDYRSVKSAMMECTPEDPKVLIVNLNRPKRQIRCLCHIYRAVPGSDGSSDTWCAHIWRLKSDAIIF